MIITNLEMKKMDIPKIISRIHNSREIIEQSIKSGANCDIEVANILKLSHELLSFSKILLIQDIDPFYGTFLLGLLTDVDLSMGAPAAITLSKPLCLKINPMYWYDMDTDIPYDYKNILAIIIHEMLHIVFDHQYDCKVVLQHRLECDIEKINIACDAAVNDIIIDMINNNTKLMKFMKLPNNTITSEWIQSKTTIPVNKCQSMYYYLNILDTLDDSCYNNINNTPHHCIATDIESENPENNYDIKTRFNGIEEHNFDVGGDGDSHEATKSFIREKVRLVWDLLTPDQRARVSGNLRTRISDLLKKVDLDIEGLIRLYAGTLPTPYKKTRARLNRRQPKRFDLKGRMNDHTIDVVIAADTSASMDNSALEYCKSLLCKVIKNRKHNIEVIECDADITRIYTANKISGIEATFKGGGGTQFSPVFEHMAKDRKRYSKSLLIYLTDGGGERKLSVEAVSHRTLWIIVNGPVSELSLEQPCGDVRSLLSDKKYENFKK